MSDVQGEEGILPCNLYHDAFYAFLYPFPPLRMNRCLWKYYLPATSLVGGKNVKILLKQKASFRVVDKRVRIYQLMYKLTNPHVTRPNGTCPKLPRSTHKSHAYNHTMMYPNILKHWMSIYTEILSIRLWEFFDENYTRKCTAFYSEVLTIFAFHVSYMQK